MPRPKIRHHKAGLLSRPGHATHNATTVTLDFPINAQTAEVAQKAQSAHSGEDGARKEQVSAVTRRQRQQSQSHSSDSDHLVRRKRQAANSRSQAKNDDLTMIRGALTENMSKANNARRRVFESDVTKRVRKSLQADEVMRKLKKPVEKVQEKRVTHKSNQNQIKPAGNPFDELGWSQDEMGTSPQTTQRVQESQEQDISHSDTIVRGQLNAASSVDGLAPSNYQPPASAQRPVSKPNGPPTPSFLSIANFKRRARQPSLLSMVQRAASRRNSVSTAVSCDDDTSLGLDMGDDSVLTLGDDEINDAPIAEDEPQLYRSTSSRKRKRGRDDIEHPSATPASSPSVGAISDGSGDEAHVQVTDSQPTRARHSLASQHPRASVATQKSLQPRTSPQLPSPKRSGPSQPAQPRTRLSRTSKPARLSSPILATSPLSTPSDSPVRTPPQPQPAVKSRKSLSRSKPKPKRPEKPITTAALASLLPKRRTRRPRRKGQEEFQILSTDSEDHSDRQNTDPEESADELAASSRARARTKRKPKTPLKGSSGNLKSPATARAGRKGKTTYGRRSSAAYDEENVQEVSSAEDGEGSVPGDRARGGERQDRSAELDAAKKKFDEVDDWEMSFESADIGAGGDSSPWR